MTSTSLGLTRVLAVLGMVASSLALAPVLYTHLTHRDHSTLLPWLTELQVSSNNFLESEQREQRQTIKLDLNIMSASREFSTFDSRAF